MPNVDTRKRMLDKILERREEIRNSEEIFKIHKYAHVFKKLLYRFRLLKKKKKIEEEAEKKIMSNDFPIKQSFNNLFINIQVSENSHENILNLSSDQIQESEIKEFEGIQKKQEKISDAIHLFARKPSKIRSQLNQPILKSIEASPKAKEKKRLPKIDTGISKKKGKQMFQKDEVQEILNKRRMALQELVQRNEGLKKKKMNEKKEQEEVIQLPKWKHLNKYYTSIDPQQIQEEIENEIYEYLMNQNHLNQFQKIHFLSPDEKTQTKSIRNLEQKIRQRITQKYLNDLDAKNKQNYSVKRTEDNNLHDIRLKNDIKLKTISLQNKNNASLVSRTLRKNLALQKNKSKFDDVQSFASYTEIKLNQLYEKSNLIQENVKIADNSQRNKQESLLVKTSKEISEISFKKMHNSGVKI